MDQASPVFLGDILGGHIFIENRCLVGNHCTVLLVIVDLVNKEETPHLPSVGLSRGQEIVHFTPYFKYN